MKLFKIISYNLIFIIILVLIFELIFGYWFSKNNFGIYMRKERKINWQTNVNFFGDKHNFFYTRNFWGFRGEEFNPEDVKIIFEGGSTGNQRFTPENLTIVGQLNNILILNNKKTKIYNASTDGKSVTGYINDFLFWFPKIPNFNPEYVIFFTGINDRFRDETNENLHNLKIADNSFEKLKDYIKNNSFFVDRYKRFKNKYFPKNTLAYDFDNKDLYKEFKYIDYENAKKLHVNKSSDINKEIKNYKARLSKLKKVISENNFKPIFVTQILYDGLKDENMYFLNEELKKFAKNNNFFLIPLDERIKMEMYDHYDIIHTTPIGSKKIADLLFIYLDEFIN